MVIEKYNQGKLSNLNTSDNVQEYREVGFYKNDIENVRNIIMSNNNITVAVTAPYGGGKTVFANILKKELEDSTEAQDKNITPIYINLWKNDYKDPLIILINEVSQLIEKDEKESFIEVASKGIGAILSITSISGINVDVSKLKNLLQGQDKDNIRDLKQKIEKIAQQKKLVFLVDELDRCKQEFSIEFLERVKHFFDIDNIIFILFVNDEYLTNLKDPYIFEFYQ